jgi:uncharacterized protein YjbI with pentapeptide repeats
MFSIKYIDQKKDWWQNLFFFTNKSLNLSGMSLHRAEFIELNLYEVDFSTTRLRSAKFIDSNFYDCDFSGVDFIAFTGLRTCFYNCTFNNTRFISSGFEDCKWINSKLDNVFIHDTEFINGGLS